VANVAAFGASLHVSGYDEDALNESLKPYMGEQYNFQFTQPGLEDVFISLIKRSEPKGEA